MVEIPKCGICGVTGGCPCRPGMTYPVAPESERANEVVRYDHCSKCESAIALVGHWEHIDKFMDTDHDARPKTSAPLTCSEVVERLAKIAEDCKQGIDERYGADIAAQAIRAHAPAILHSWRERRVQELEAFKRYVHDRLDAMGVPHSDPESEHDKAGCRIGGRLDIVEKALAKSEQIRKGAKHE